MKEVIVSVQPFILNQQVYLFEGTNIVNHFEVPLKDLSEELVAFCYANDVMNVNLKGDAQFVAKVKQDAETKEMTQYSSHKLQINAI